MKKRAARKLISAALLVLLMTGCGEEERLRAEIDDLRTESVSLQTDIADLKRDKAALEAQITNIRVEHDLARYIITVHIGQKHTFWDYKNNAKDAINAVEIQIPVDKEYFDSVEIGTVINADLRVGSLIMSGSVGSWDIRITDKIIQ